MKRNIFLLMFFFISVQLSFADVILYDPQVDTMTVYKGRDCPYRLKLSYEGDTLTASEIDAFTDIKVLFNSEYIDNTTCPTCFDFGTSETTFANEGMILVDLGSVNFTAGTDTEAELIAYDATYTNGRVIGTFKITVTADALAGASLVDPLTGAYIFKTVAIPGQSSIVADSITDTLNIAAGSGITLTSTAVTDTLIITSTGAMVYPGAGIPISTGTSWGTSITNNSSNWNTAYGWGNHALVGYLTSQTSHTDVLQDGDFTSQGIMLRGASSGTYSILTDNSTNWNTAYGWGNHASAGYVTGTPWTGMGYLTSESDPLALKTAGTDNVKDTHIDWGAGVGQVSTDDMTEGSTNKYERDSGTNTGDETLVRLQGLVTNDFHNLGGTDANTTYTAGTGMSLAAGAFNCTITQYADSDIDGNESAFSGWDKNASDDFAWDFDYSDLINKPTIVDWTSDQGATNIHAGNYTDTDTLTALSVGTKTATTVAITSDGGADDVVIPEADTDNAGLLSAAKWDEIVANSLKVTFPGFTSLFIDYGFGTSNISTAGVITSISAGAIPTGAVADGETTKVPTCDGVYDFATGNFLKKDNTVAFTPDADYEPATKKYVDDNSATYQPLDADLTDIADRASTAKWDFGTVTCTDYAYSFATSGDCTVTLAMSKRGILTDKDLTGNADFVLDDEDTYLTMHIYIVDGTDNISLVPPTGECLMMDGAFLDANDEIDLSSTEGDKFTLVRRYSTAKTDFVWDVETVRGSTADGGAGD